MYPVPGFVTVIPVTAPPLTVAVAAKPVPFVPVFVTTTVGALVYPAPAVTDVVWNPCIKLPGVQLISSPVLVELKLIQSKFSFANLPVVVPNF